MLARFQIGDEPDPDMSSLVRMVHAAYQVLSDPVERRTYDADLASDAEQADAELKSILDAQSYGYRRVQDIPPALVQALRRWPRRRPKVSGRHGIFPTANSDAVGDRSFIHDPRQRALRPARCTPGTSARASTDRRAWGSRARDAGSSRPFRTAFVAQAQASGATSAPGFIPSVLH